MFLIKHFAAVAAHLGHKTNKWNPRTASFLFAIKDDIHLIDLEQTALAIRRALNFIKIVCEKRGRVLVRFANAPVPLGPFGAIGACGGPAKRGNVNGLTKATFPTTALGQSSERETEGPLIASLKKKKRTCLKETGTQKFWSLTGLSETMRGTQSAERQWPNEARRIPEALCVLSVRQEAILIKEAIKLQLPIIGVVDSDSNPFGIQFPVPGNDDSVHSVQIYVKLIMEAMADAKKKK